MKNGSYISLNELSTKVKKDKNLQLITNFFEKKIEEYNNEFDSNKKSLNTNLESIDSDKNGIVDVIEISDDFKKLLSKYQSIIINNDKTYIQKFIKLSNYLKDRRENIQTIFNSIQESKWESDKIELMNILKESINTYEILVVHSLNMIVSLKEDDFISFYEIYEMFDKLNVFNSNWENEVSEKLTDIGNGLVDLMYSIQKMELNIRKELENLSYITEESFNNLSESVTNELQSIGSSIESNNLLNVIQTYQMYKINQNTKGLRG